MVQNHASSALRNGVAGSWVGRRVGEGIWGGGIWLVRWMLGLPKVRPTGFVVAVRIAVVAMVLSPSEFCGSNKNISGTCNHEGSAEARRIGDFSYWRQREIRADCVNRVGASPASSGYKDSLR